uniref:WSC domain-containing protein n=1 Tax=Macrostomum lignano TaxID=282301 RepID=A0A1I8HBE1_9PLAT
YYCNASCFNYLYHKKCGGRGAIEVFDLKPVPKIYSGQSALDVYEPEGAPIDMQPMIPVDEDFKYMSQRVCATHCLMEKTWKYFGLFDGRRCFCGDEIRSRNVLNLICNVQCYNYLYGEKCGGRDAMEIFDLVPVPKNYSGETA